MELYKYATAEPHNALVVDGTNGAIQFKRNFDKLLTFNNAEVEEHVDNH